MNTSKWVGFFLVAVFLHASPVEGVSVRSVNLVDMVNVSGRVFYGRCLSVDEAVEPVTRMKVLVYRFQVLDGIKGVATGEIVTVRQLGAEVPGMPGYAKGEHLLLFLYPESRLGLTSPVGMVQGTFLPYPTDRGELNFGNPVGNSNLAEEIETSDAVSVLSDAEVTSLRSRERLGLGQLKDMVGRIERYQAEEKRREK